MPAKKSADPLVTLPLRVRQSLRERIRDEAAASRITMSDAIRRRLKDPSAPPLGRPVPRRRTMGSVELGAVIKADPMLMRQLAAVGSNLNQLARAVNTGAVSGRPMDAVSVLATLLSLEKSLDRIATAHRAERS